MAYDIIILGGQSNAEGYGLGPTEESFVPDDRILMMRDKGPYGYIEQPDGTKPFIVTQPYTFVTETAREKIENGEVQGSFWLSFAKKYIEAGLLDEGRQLLMTLSQPLILLRFTQN